MIGVTLRDSSGRSFRASRRRWAIAGANMRTRGALAALPLRSTQPTAEPQQKASQKDYQPANNSGTNAEPDDSRLLHDGCPCRDAAAPPAGTTIIAGVRVTAPAGVGCTALSVNPRRAARSRKSSGGAHSACVFRRRACLPPGTQQPARRVRGHPLGCGLGSLTLRLVPGASRAVC